jgi:hypothetical protein
MNIHRFFARPAFKAAALACALAGTPLVSSAGVGMVTLPDLYGGWFATFSGVTGCGPTAMQLEMRMGSTGIGEGRLTMHGQCGNSVLPGQTFRVLTLDPSGAGTANLSCGQGCGWNLSFQVSPDRQIMNLVDIDPMNPGSYIAGVAVHY